MLHRHPHPGAKAVADFLNERHHTGLTDEDVAEALQSLGLNLVAADETRSATVADSNITDSNLVCLDGPEGCTGDVTTVTGSRHFRCEQHWSTFLESEGM
ncbi:MAG: hypothetical protein OEM81_00200 [Acidimicrobiia bacterium]|nr:hypothetical protein [Acidimicrobiia bacterium]MDH3396232.1 hypothetical protein [Acidimicrobiia bacterium]MDH5615330.1 hypothetical protein [Acidimicrobiia bacterium]